MEKSALRGLFRQQVKVVNVGIESFYDDLKSQDVPVVQMNWSVPNEEDKQNRDLANRLAELLGR